MIEISLVDNLFAKLEPENRNKILFKALRKGALKLASETTGLLKAKLGSGASTGKKFGTPLEKGVKVKAEKAYNEVLVHIMGDFRLKFFEKGTKERITKGARKIGSGRNLRRTGKGGYRGSIKALNFFRAARENESQINSVIFESLDKSFKKL